MLLTHSFSLTNTKKEEMDVPSELLPAWYHGNISRSEATRLLLENGGESGLFLVRASSSGSGYVLSMCHDTMQVSHYQIRSENIGGEDFLTFDTDTGVAPRFHSLSSVVQHLYTNPAHLPVQLGEWVSHASQPLPFEHEAPPEPPARASLQFNNATSTVPTATDGSSSSSISRQPACDESINDNDDDDSHSDTTTAAVTEVENPEGFGFDLPSTSSQSDNTGISKTGSLSKVCVCMYVCVCMCVWFAACFVS